MATNLKEQQVRNRFCYWQSHTSDRRDGKPDCNGAQLEGHNCICPFTQADIKYGEVHGLGERLYVSRPGNELDEMQEHACEDVKFLPSVERRLKPALVRRHREFSGAGYG